LLAVKSVNGGSSPGPLRGGIHCISPCRETNRTPPGLASCTGQAEQQGHNDQQYPALPPAHVQLPRRPVMMRLTKAKGPRSGGGAVLSGSDLVLTVTPGGQSLAKAIRVIRRMGCGSNRQKIFLERQSPRCSDALRRWLTASAFASFHGSGHTSWTAATAVTRDRAVTYAARYHSQWFWEGRALGLTRHDLEGEFWGIENRGPISRLSCAADGARLRAHLPACLSPRA
jgi:hypothetical protein